MTNDDKIHTVVLQEFRLLAPDADGAVARIVASADAGGELRIPMLTSIGDRRDVATVRASRSEPHEDDHEDDMKAALSPYVAGWPHPKRYRPRIAVRSQSPPAYFRLAVTESGINEPGSDPEPVRQRAAAEVSAQPWLLWIAPPVGTHAGMLVLIGQGADERRPEPLTWPLPLSSSLGVRIYDNRADTAPAAMTDASCAERALP